MKRFLKGFIFAFEGLFESLKSGLNLKVHFAAAFIVIIASFLFALNQIEWCIVLLCIGSVIAAELMNTAIEHTVDLVHGEFHPLAKKAKDAGAASVLAICFIAAIIACILFIPKLIVCLNTFYSH